MTTIMNLIFIHNLIPPTAGALEIFANIFIIEVLKINNIELTMTFKVYFALSWTESIFHINKASPKWGEVGVAIPKTRGI